MSILFLSLNSDDFRCFPQHHEDGSFGWDVSTALARDLGMGRTEEARRFQEAALNLDKLRIILEILYDHPQGQIEARRIVHPRLPVGHPLRSARGFLHILQLEHSRTERGTRWLRQEFWL